VRGGVEAGSLGGEELLAGHVSVEGESVRFHRETVHMIRKMPHGEIAMPQRQIDIDQNDAEVGVDVMRSGIYRES
jgi:hypothetical protein